MAYNNLEMFYNNKVPFNKLEVGELYFAKEIPEYERNNEGYEWPVWDPASYLVKIVSKSGNSVNADIVRNYENPYRPYPFPSERITLSSYYYDFERPSKKEMANASRKERLNEYKQKMIELRAIKKSGLPSNIAGEIGSYITGVPIKSTIVGVPGKSFKEQEKELQKHIKQLEKKYRFERPPESLLNGGRKTRRRRHLKRGFKSLKRKTT